MQILAQVSKVSMMHNKLKHGLPQQLQIPSEHVAVASTGVIGEYLPMDKIKLVQNVLGC